MLHSICQQIWKTLQWPQDWKRSVFIPMPKKGNAKECSNYHIIALISHTSKVMHKILRVSLQQYMNREFPGVQAGFRKGRRTRDQIANICWFIKKAREFQKNIPFCFIDVAKTFDCEDHNKLWMILKDIGMPEHLTYLLKTCVQVKKKHLEPDMEQQTGFRLGKEYCILSLCLFNLYTEYMMQNTRLDENKLESRLMGEISITSDRHMTPPLWQKVKKN